MDDNINLNMTEIINKEKYNKNPLFGSVFSKFNKPFIVSKPNLFENANIKTKYSPVLDFKTNSTIALDSEDESSNYICVDKYTNMVLESKQTLLVIFQII